MGREKKSQSSNTHMRQNRFQIRANKKDQEGHFIIHNERIHHEDINVINITFIFIGAPT